jgi:hypothetical protein
MPSFTRTAFPPNCFLIEPGAFYYPSPSPDKTLKLYDGYWHHSLNDIGKEVVMADITAWIEARLPSGVHLRAGA